MANKKNWLGILVIVLVFGMAVIGCATFSYQAPEFPPEFRGTWKREGIDNILTITANTYTLSHQQGTYWILERVSGDTYTISQNSHRSNRGPEIIRYVNGNLVVDPIACGGEGLDNCGGTWIRQ